MESDILDSLEQLGYGGPLLEEEALLRVAEGGLSSPEYVELCRWLTDRLKPLCGLEESITSGPDDVDSLQLEMSGLLKELHCPYEEVVSGILKGSVRNTKDHLKLVLFLSSELQAAQILRSRRDSDKQREASPECRELLVICETLNLPESRGQDAAGVFSQIQDKVDKLLKDLPSGSIGDPVLNKCLCSEQWEKLHNINKVLGSEYECRRRMLIKRLDVTVRVDSMARAYQPKRHSLKPQSTVGTAELLAAREDICNVVKTSSGSSRENTSCAVNKTEEDVPQRYKPHLLRCQPGKKDKMAVAEEVVVAGEAVVVEEEEEVVVEVGGKVDGTKEDTVDIETMEDTATMEGTADTEERED
ncbi:hypothetical protein L3Q82_026457, partial [Scortum barcoo]